MINIYGQVFLPMIIDVSCEEIFERYSVVLTKEVCRITKPINANQLPHLNSNAQIVLKNINQIPVCKHNCEDFCQCMLIQIHKHQQYM